jgi:hypothetical protein
MRSTGCAEEKPADFFSATTGGSYPHTEDDRRGREAWPAIAKIPACRVSVAGYRSSVCSTQESPLGRLARAIDDLAADSRDGAATDHLAERIAQLWRMLGELDPELAKRRSRYERTTDRTDGDDGVASEP